MLLDEALKCIGSARLSFIQEEIMDYSDETFKSLQNRSGIDFLALKETSTSIKQKNPRLVKQKVFKIFFVLFCFVLFCFVLFLDQDFVSFK